MGKVGKESEQIADPVTLRGGFRGLAYEAVRGIGHSELITSTEEDGKPNHIG